MPTYPHDSGNVTTVAIEMEPGWVYFKISGPKPESSRNEFFLRRAVEEWFGKRPTFLIKKVTVITAQGEIVGIHVWYDRVDIATSLPKTSGRVDFGIDVHGQIAAVNSKEYIEAVVTDALKILPSYEHRRDTLVVVNPRRLAVILDKQTCRGAVIPVGFIEQVVEGGMKQRLQAWLAAPAAPFYVMHIAGSLFRSKE